jgi:O-antigen/teichoic acid export membrane protein
MIDFGRLNSFLSSGRRRMGRTLEALSRSGFFISHRDKMAGGAEQMLSSATSMIGLIMLSRMMDIYSFGIVATASGIWLMVEMIQHSATIGPFILSCPHPAQDRESFGAWILWNLLVAIVLCCSFILGGLLLWPHLPDFAHGLFLSGPLCLAGMLYMFIRRLQYHLANRKALLLQAGLYSVSYLGTVGIMWFQGIKPTPAEGTLIQIVGFAVPVLVTSFSAIRPAKFRLGAMRNIWRARKLIGELGTAGIIWQLPYTITLLALSVLANPVAVAIFTITRTLVRPITLVMATIGDVELSRASRAYAVEGVEGLTRVIRRARNSLWLLNGAFIVLLLAFPSFFLKLVYGQQYADAGWELQLRVMLFLPLIYLAPLDMGLAVLRDTRFLLHIYLISLAGCLGYLAVAYLNGSMDAASALASLVFARVLVIPFMHRRYFRKALSLTAHRSALAAPG